MAREGVGEVAGGESAGLGIVEVMASTAEGLGDAPTRDWRLCRCYAKLALVHEDENHMCTPECKYSSGGMFVPYRGPIRFDILARKQVLGQGTTVGIRKLAVQYRITTAMGGLPASSPVATSWSPFSRARMH